MDEQVAKVMFALIRRAVFGVEISVEDRVAITPEILSRLYVLSKAHDMAHIVAQGLADLGLLGANEFSAKFQKQQMLAVYRYQKLNYEFERICQVMENAKIPFFPLKGAVIRKYYSEPWMRTSCDIDILVHEEQLEPAATVLVNHLGYLYHEKSSHDISLFSPDKIHIELHYDLVEHGLVNASSAVLKDVWNVTSVRNDFSFWHEMSDEMFYFYHIAHMAKHFVHGGCGIKPFIDLLILDNLESANHCRRDELLARGNLLQFAQVARKLSKVWFADMEGDMLSQKMASYILRGGVYGINENRITVQQQKKGGKLKYALSKIFLPYDIIKFHYPILQQHRWLTPIMEIRRWCKLIFCGHAQRAIQELVYNQNISQEKATSIQNLLKNIGL